MGSQGGFPGGFSGLKPTGLTGSCVTFPFFFFLFFLFLLQLSAFGRSTNAGGRLEEDHMTQATGRQGSSASGLQGFYRREGKGAIREQFGSNSGCGGACFCWFLGAHRQTCVALAMSLGAISCFFFPFFSLLFFSFLFFW